mgnify:FL=1
MFALAGAMTACNADMDVDIAAPILSAPSAESIQGSLQGDDYVLSWSGTSGKMQVTRYANGAKAGSEIVEGNSYTHRNVDTNIKYMYILKLTDGSNFSSGVIKEYTRLGAGKCSNPSMAQIEKVGGYDASVEWSNENTNATKINLVANNGGGRQITEALDANTTKFTIPDVLEGETWNVTLVAENGEGKSLPINTSLRIGKLAVAYLSLYDTPEELIANGDDDEAYGWVWFHATYPNGAFVPFSSITSADVLKPYRVAFFMRDIDDPGKVGYDAWTYPEAVNNATPYVAEWYKNGGSMLLWGHATTYVGHLGRLDLKQMRELPGNIGYGGDNNPDTWKMAVQLNTGKLVQDNSNHPLFRGLDAEDAVVEGRETKLIPFKYGQFTEDHNCLYFDLPTILTGIGNEEEACYNTVTRTYGIIPLGTWDGQCKWVSQLNVWECQPGNTDFQGTLICVGNGGCNFYLKQADGSFDVTKQPSTNAYQDNIERMAKNAIEYLKTR